MHLFMLTYDLNSLDPAVELYLINSLTLTGIIFIFFITSYAICI